MITPKYFKTFEEFVEFNRAYIESNPLQNIFLIRVISAVVYGQTTVYKFFNLIGDIGEQIIALVVDDFCLLYTDNYNPDCLELLSKKLEFEKFNKYTFAGNKNLVENLLSFNKANYSLDKHLAIYKSSSLTSDINITSGKIRLADLKEIESLAEHSIEFTKEYDGNEETLNTMRSMLKEAIENEYLYVWDDNGICAMALVMQKEEFEFPEIGHVYTLPSKRNQGYSTSLIFKLTKILLQNFDFVMLYTHGENPSSNKVFMKAGYEKTGDYVRCFKE